MNIFNDVNNIITKYISESDITSVSQFCNDEKEIEIYNEMIKKGETYIFAFDTLLKKQKIQLQDILQYNQQSMMVPNISFYLIFTDKQTNRHNNLLITVSYLPDSNENEFAIIFKKKNFDTNQIRLVKDSFIKMFVGVTSFMKNNYLN